MAKVLLVENDRNQGALCREVLTDEGYEVTLARNGREAIPLLAKHPDVVILDLHMPNMDGIEALGRILSFDNTQPVIIHSAYPAYMDNFMTWSADAFVVKSADFGELKATIHSVLTPEDAPGATACPSGSRF